MSEQEYKVGDKVVLNCTVTEFCEYVEDGAFIYEECFKKGYAVVEKINNLGYLGGVWLEGLNVILGKELKYIKPLEEPLASDEVIKRISDHAANNNITFEEALESNNPLTLLERIEDLEQQLRDSRSLLEVAGKHIEYLNSLIED